MEPAKIDWKNIQSIYIQDDLYEYINAPKWVDFSASDDSVDDETWFCKPDCRHPKTAEDFLAPIPNSKVKHVRSATNSEILPLGDRNSRDPNLKRRLVISSSSSSSSIPWNKEAKPKFQEDDGENENPNLHTPNHRRKQVKASIKSSSEKKKPLMNDLPPNYSHEDQRKNALSARNLGKEIFNQITEICNELKKLALEEENKNSETHIAEVAKEKHLIDSSEACEMEKEKKPMLQAEKGNCRDTASKKKMKKEGISVELKKVAQRGEEGLLQVRTSPPTPQCFSSASSRMPLHPRRTTTALNPSTPPERRRVLQETELNDRVVITESGEKSNRRNIAVSGTETKSLDMFWFLRPCTFLAK